MWTTEEYEDQLARAGAGDVQAMFHVAIFHNLRGDMDEAHAWFEKAANAGAIEARAYLGWVCRMKDLTGEAIRWTRLAAADGNVHAEAMLNMLLNPTDDTRPEIVVAAHTSKILGDGAASLGNSAQARSGWFTSADMGNLEAMTLMGQLEEREGALGAAILWHERAAVRGSNESMLRLGMIHRRRGNATLASEWFTLAAQSGNVEASKVLQGLAG